MGLAASGLAVAALGSLAALGLEPLCSMVTIELHRWLRHRLGLNEEDRDAFCPPVHLAWLVADALARWPAHQHKLPSCQQLPPPSLLTPAEVRALVGQVLDRDANAGRLLTLVRYLGQLELSPEQSRAVGVHVGRVLMERNLSAATLGSMVRVMNVVCNPGSGRSAGAK